MPRLVIPLSVVVFVLSAFLGTAQASGALHLLFVDTENTVSLERYLREEKERLQTWDMFVLFDARISEPMTREVRIRAAHEKKKRKKDLDTVLLRDLDEYLEHWNETREIRIRIKQHTYQERDVARMFSTAGDYIRLYRQDFDQIHLIFFGNSLFHAAHGHNFQKGIPSDGFFARTDSEFNTIPDIQADNLSVRFYFDDEPRYKQGLFRFYQALVKKKFGIRLSAFNSSAAPDSLPAEPSDQAAFFLDEIRVIAEGGQSDCGTPDRTAKNYRQERAVLDVELVNPCRINTLITFIHNESRQQKMVDANGRVTVSFNLKAGLNQIRFMGLDGNWQELLSENIEPRSDTLVFTLDPSTNTVLIEGHNPFRFDGDIVPIDYQTTGARYNLEVKQGRFSKEVAVKPGVNVFKYKDFNGETREKVIRYSSRCSDEVEFDEAAAKEHGLLTATLKNACRENGSLAKFLYDGKTFHFVMENGQTVANIVLRYEVNEVFYENFDRNITKLTSLKIRDYADLIRLWTTYNDNVLALPNVFEPGTEPPKPPRAINYQDRSQYRAGHLHDDQPASASGEFLIYEAPAANEYLNPKLQRTYEQIYVSRKSKLGKGEMYFYVDYFSRHGSLQYATGRTQPLCGNQSLGGIVIEYDLLFDGAAERGRKFLDPSRCQISSSSSQLKPAPEDSLMVLLKKVLIE